MSTHYNWLLHSPEEYGARFPMAYSNIPRVMFGRHTALVTWRQYAVSLYYFRIVGFSWFPQWFRDTPNSGPIAMCMWWRMCIQGWNWQTQVRLPGPNAVVRWGLYALMVALVVVCTRKLVG